jgi:hypothetical protein
VSGPATSATISGENVCLNSTTGEEPGLVWHTGERRSLAERPDERERRSAGHRSVGGIARGRFARAHPVKLEEPQNTAETVALPLSRLAAAAAFLRPEQDHKPLCSAQGVFPRIVKTGRRTANPFLQS